MSIRVVPAGCKPVNLSNLLTFLKKLDGRDKSLKFVQYFSRYLMHQLYQLNPKSELGDRLQKLYKGVSLHRKAFRLGMFMDEYKKFETTLAEAKDDLKKTLDLVKSAAMGLFYLHDNLIWLVSLKVLTGDKDRLKLRQAYFRWTAAVVTTIMCVMDISATQEKIIATEPGTKDRVKAEENQGKNTIAMAKNIADMLVYGNSAKFVAVIKGSGYDDGTLGLMGSISALAGGYATWLKM
mmetsp:Transcript_16142/g.20013  ORF Transcript_16142/g.20013 Transcript_16142/m.20013 type:complete len:237 (+) Transcript_16142:270-980(+)|eukprot:CAMPEP_0204822728 /NCGR_PEP_ID=MMETSP1346-20131115/915_1 /ASSEMBLY_ACC=CAM_ASM_000771 /TAXON_ID=215587 /ORGANISM="Aplanochytrium stocchinoi, Strain GSBS06" /LENGTH=236 /DNA_ID=CAMNT_0051949089 /DNA_START=146 /DNA_END=856 /DNA_ORIENTATION=+